MRLFTYILVLPIVLFASNQVLAQPIASTGKTMVHVHLHKHVAKKKHSSSSTTKPAPSNQKPSTTLPSNNNQQSTTNTQTTQNTQQASTNTQPTQNNQQSTTTQSTQTPNTQPSQSTTPSTVSNTNTQTNVSAVEQEVVRLVNVERTNRGLKPLTIDSTLCKIARLKSSDMATHNYFDHQSPTYGSPFDMMHQFGVTFQTAGENIAAGQQSAADVMNSWMNSQGHRDNILNPAFTHIGVGFVSGGTYGTYWTQEFTG